MPFNYGKVGSGSSTDDEQQTHPGPGRNTFWTRICDTTRWLRWPSTFFLLFVILAAEISILHKQPSSIPIGDEVNGIVPTFGTHQKKFLADDRYHSDHRTQTSINSTKQNWLDLVPKGGGFLHIADYKTHTLPPPMHFPELPEKHVFALAVFHQMHCLYHMTAYIDTMVLQLRARNYTVDEHQLAHNNHCFNYLKNAIMCNADTSLEGQAPARGGMQVPGTDGTGGMHVCRDYDEVFAWAERNRLYDVVHL